MKKELKPFLVELLPSEYAKLERLINEGKYRTKIDFVRTKIRQE